MLVESIKKAKAYLASEGFEHICSIMTDGCTKEYGLVFLKDGKKVYLNKDTVGEILPK